MAIITLTTDFGYKDHYVACMKGVILSICPSARIIDITHGVEQFNVWDGAYALLCSYKYFPRGTIHVVVVDPGVGTERRAIALKTKNYIFIGPDNGVLMLAAEDDGIVEARSISNPSYTLPSISATFHGRDVFAPAAANIAAGRPFELIGPRLDPAGLVRLPVLKPRVSGSSLVASVIHVDSFGNAATSARTADVQEVGLRYGDTVEIVAGKSRVKARFVPSFGHVSRGEPLCLINSAGFLEIAVNQGSAAEMLGISAGDSVVVRKLMD